MNTEGQDPRLRRNTKDLGLDQGHILRVEETTEIDLLAEDVKVHIEDDPGVEVHQGTEAPVHGDEDTGAEVDRGLRMENTSPDRCG